MEMAGAAGQSGGAKEKSCSAPLSDDAEGSRVGLLAR